MLQPMCGNEQTCKSPHQSKHVRTRKFIIWGPSMRAYREFGKFWRFSIRGVTYVRLQDYIGLSGVCFCYSFTTVGPSQARAVTIQMSNTAPLKEIRGRILSFVHFKVFISSEPQLAEGRQQDVMQNKQGSAMHRNQKVRSCTCQRLHNWKYVTTETDAKRAC